MIGPPELQSATGLSLLLCTGACVGGPDLTPEQIRERIVAAERAGDASDVVRHFAPDGIYTFPGETPVVGAEAVGDFLQDACERLAISTQDTSSGLRNEQGTLVDRGTATFTYRARDGGDTQAEEFPCRLVFQSDASGGLQIQSLTLGSNQAPESLIAAEGLSLDRLERDLIVQALERSGGNESRAARLLGVSRDTLRYRLEKHGLEALEE